MIQSGLTSTRIMTIFHNNSGVFIGRELSFRWKRFFVSGIASLMSPAHLFSSYRLLFSTLILLSSSWMGLFSTSANLFSIHKKAPPSKAGAHLIFSCILLSPQAPSGSSTSGISFYPQPFHQLPAFARRCSSLSYRARL
ncbi:hypothetical protein GA0061094_2982 [[Bacillus] enclensis]|uniref:Uncharacterized protein n=1 Tax=[Bacillus] enclensis TaxID=1402860 RepID=A0A1C4CHM8_9BACI|nr:hypothetical protein GA0061094_2982 [[Bacillus] enclensis]